MPIALCFANWANEIPEKKKKHRIFASKTKAVRSRFVAGSLCTHLYWKVVAMVTASRPCRPECTTTNKIKSFSQFYSSHNQIGVKANWLILSATSSPIVRLESNLFLQCIYLAAGYHNNAIIKSFCLSDCANVIWCKCRKTSACIQRGWHERCAVEAKINQTLQVGQRISACEIKHTQ